MPKFRTQPEYVCTKCKVQKTRNDFHTDRARPNGYHSWCKTCHSEHRYNRRRNDPVFAAEDKERSRLFKVNNPVLSKRLITNSTLKNKYGITLDDYQELVKIQQGLCAICEEPETHIDKRNGKVKRLAVDHIHGTKIVRGLLCHSCNTSLGHMDENPERLRKAAAYIEEHSNTHLDD